MKAEDANRCSHIESDKKNIRSSIPFSFDLCTEGTAMTDACDHFLKIIQQEKQPKRFHEKKWRDNLELTLINLYRHHLDQYHEWLSISYSKSNSLPPKRYRGDKKLSIDLLRQIREALLERGYIEYVPAYNDMDKTKGYSTSRTSSIRATNKLIDKIFKPFGFDTIVWHKDMPEVVILKSGSTETIKELKDYEDTSRTAEIRSNLKNYNQLLAQTAIVHPTYKYSPKDCKVTRIFNYQSFEHGGRFYGGWWLNMPSKLRPKLTINGDAIVELDYRALHVTMCYHMMGINYTEDPYTLEQYDNYPQKNTLRDVTKQIPLVWLNAKTYQGAYLAVRNNLQELNEKGKLNYPEFLESGVELKELVNAFQQMHPQLVAQFFLKQVGTHLQNIDSMIAEYIINYFTAQQIPVLCYHDGFVCQQQYQAELNQVMNEAYILVMQHHSALAEIMPPAIK